MRGSPGNVGRFGKRRRRRRRAGDLGGRPRSVWHGVHIGRQGWRLADGDGSEWGAWFVGALRRAASPCWAQMGFAIMLRLVLSAVRKAEARLGLACLDEAWKCTRGCIIRSRLAASDPVRAYCTLQHIKQSRSVFARFPQSRGTGRRAETVNVPSGRECLVTSTGAAPVSPASSRYCASTQSTACLACVPSRPGEKKSSPRQTPL